MTKVRFFHGAEDRLQAAVAWLAGAYAQGRRVLVYAPDPLAAASLDRLLWTQPPTGFLPHCRADAPLAAQTPVRIADRLEALDPEQCLLNLADEVPPGFSRFEEIVEIVGSAEPELLPARSRFKFYRDRGYPLENQRFAAPAAGDGA